MVEVEVLFVVMVVMEVEVLLLAPEVIDCSCNCSVGSIINYDVSIGSDGYG